MTAATNPADAYAVLDATDPLRRNADQARHIYAQTLAHLFTEYVREIFPDATDLLCEIRPDASTDTGIDAQMLMIRRNATVMWASDTARARASWEARNAWAHKEMPALSIGTVAYLESALEQIYHHDKDVFRFSDDSWLISAALEYPAFALDLRQAMEWDPATVARDTRPYHSHAVLEALANAGGARTEDQLCGDVGPVLALADIPALAANGYITLDREAEAEGFPYRLTEEGTRELARAHNGAAVFLPAADPGPAEDGGGQYPALSVAGVQVYAYVDKQGTLRVSVHCDGGGDIPAWLKSGDLVPLTVTVDGETVFTA